MNADLQQSLDDAAGVAERNALLAAVPRHVLDHAVRSRQLVRVLPWVYADPARLTDPKTRARAALTYAGPGTASSHLTALGVWRLPGGDLHGPIHLLVGRTRRLRAATGVVVHRRTGFLPQPPEVVLRSGLPTCRLERAVVDSWPLLPVDTRRAAVIGAVGDRLTTPHRLHQAITACHSLPGRAELLRLAGLLARGCRSELELWGYQNVFTGPGMPPLEWDVRVRAGDRTVQLDAYCRAARVNFELDGARWHTSKAARERDTARDQALAAMGILVVRFTHDQLVDHPEQVRAQVRAIIAAPPPRCTGVTALPRAFPGSTG